MRKRYAYQSETVFGDDYSYDYLPNNLLNSMTDGEGHLISYAYEPSRNLLLKIDYPTDEDIVFGEVQGDGSIVTGYDKAHRPTRYQDETGVCTTSYDALGRLDVAIQGNVFYEQVTTYDAWSRPSLMRCRPVGANDGDAQEWTCSYTYDVAGRLETLIDSQVSANPFTYVYHPRANFIESLTHPNGLATTKSWDARGILGEVTTRDNAANILKSHQYGLNALRQRETITREDAAELTFGYDQQRQLIDGEKTTVGASFPDYDYGFTFDEIGNWETADKSADVNSGAGSLSTYIANSQNQYSSITTSGVTFAPTYDDNGSLLNDGRITLQWQERNRLDRVTENASGKSSHYRYDAMGRRLEREDYDAANSLVKTTRYLYKGWNCVAEFDVPSSGSGISIREKTYTWGLDLSQSQQGAGGVGGLCSVTDESGTQDVSYHYVYDGNGNVVALYDDNQVVAASYEYSPFGQLIAKSGPYSDENTYRFSSKPQNDYSGELIYYGYRYYDPVTGRWPSRDPIEEEGGVNLYSMINNDLINEIDFLGLLPEGIEAVSENTERPLPNGITIAGDPAQQNNAAEAPANNNGAAAAGNNGAGAAGGGGWKAGLSNVTRIVKLKIGDLINGGIAIAPPAGLPDPVTVGEVGAGSAALAVCNKLRAECSKCLLMSTCKGEDCKAICDAARKCMDAAGNIKGR